MMKQLYLLFLATLASVLSIAQSLPVDFETPVTFTDFAGGASTIISNPQSGGINTSAKVAQMVKNGGAGAEVYGGSFFSLAAPIDFAAGKTFRMKVYSPRAGAKVLLKVENQSNGGIFFEKQVLTTVANAWEDLSFDYSAISTANSYQKIVIIFDNGTKGDGSANYTFFYDDIRLEGTGGGGGGLTQMNLPVTFDLANVEYGLIGFGGVDAAVVTDPTDAANKVGRVLKSNTAELWAGATITGAAQLGFSSKIPFTATDKKLSVRVWSPNAGIPVRLKAEDHADPNKSVETEATVTLASGWQTLEFDFGNQAAGTAALNLAYNYDKVSIFFNFGTTGASAGEKTYYFDDVKFVTTGGGGGGLTQMNLPVTFDLATVDYGLIGFGGVDASIVADPTDAANKVGKAIKTNTAELWAGVTVTAAAQLGFSSKIPFTASDKKMSIKVWSPHAGIPVRLKAEDHTDPNKSVETEATVTVASGWQTLEFDFGNPVSGTAALNLAYNYDKVSIFFNFGTTGAVAGERTYYFDDVKFISGGGPTLTQMNLPVTFDLATVDYGLIGFGGAENSTIVTDPTDASNKVAKVIKSAGAELWAGTTITAAAQLGFSSKIPFTASNTKMTVRVWSPDAGIPVRLKVEDHTDPNKSVETEATVTTAAGWQTLEFDFSKQAAGTAALNLALNYDKASIFFNFGTTGAVAGEKTYYFDDVKMAPGVVFTQMNLPVTFESSTVDYGLVGFGGAENSTIVTDPTNDANKVAKVIKSGGAELWAGTTITAVTNNVQTGFSSKIPFTILNRILTLRVWSPNAGIPIRLKVEDSNDPTKSVESEVVNTVAGGWETLIFDFGKQATGTAALNLSYNYNKASIFFNFGTTGAVAGEKTYYFDDLTFGVTLALSVDYFNVEKKDNRAFISWSAAGTSNIKTFTVQRSTNGQTWTDIATVNAVKAGAVANKYSATDNQPFNGINYYRLVEIDGNGNRQHSAIKALNFAGVNVGTRVYPNPAKNLINIVSEPMSANAYYRVTNAEGKTMLAGNIAKGSTVVPVNISELKAGIYQLQLINNAGSNSFKFLKL